MSDFIRQWELLRFGPATKTDTRRSVAAKPFDRQQRDLAQASLMYPPVEFTGHQALDIARGFANGVLRSAFIILACAILPDHVHMVIVRHGYDIEQVVNRLKGAATRELSASGNHPLGAYQTNKGTSPSPWAQKMWKVYLNSPAEILRAIKYVEGNPKKEAKRPQVWPFVTSFDDLTNV